MNYQSDYESILPQLEALDVNNIWRPRAPIDVIALEGESLFKWAGPDKDILTANGLDWSLVESLPQRAGALRQAESIYIADKSRTKEASTQWEAQSPEGFELRHFLLRTFRYAFKNSPEALEQVKPISEGKRQSDMVLDLNSLAVLGEQHRDKLEAIGFDFSLLETARTSAKHLGELLADYRISSFQSHSLEMRNRAYTFLQLAINEIRSCGQYSFFGNNLRLAGYTSHYKRYVKRQKQTNQPTESGEQKPVE